MALNTVAVADALVAILEAIAEVVAAGEVGIGVPESTGKRVSAYVTMGSQPNGQKATGLIQRDARYMILLAYRVDKDQELAERTLMSMVDHLLAALYADLKLGGACSNIEIDTGLADTPDYQLRAGKEFREYPVIVTARQYANYTTGA